MANNSMTRAQLLQCVANGDYASLTEEERKELFVQEVKKHDLTQQHLYMIKTMAQHLNQDFVKETWNAMVDKCLVASEAPNWYWKG